MSDLIKKDDIEQHIQNAEDINQLKQIDNLFKLSRIKKEMFRVMKWEELQDKILDTAISRVETNSSYIRNDELLSFLKATQTSADRAQKVIEELTNQAPAIPQHLSQVQQNNIVNVTYVESDDRESRGKVSKAVLDILAQINQVEPIIMEKINENNNIESNENLEDDEYNILKGED